MVGATLMEIAPNDNYVRVILIDAEGRLLIQRRSDGKILYPSVWEYAAGGRKEHGETWEQAALRELHEELGIAKQSEDLELLLDFILDATYCGRPLAVRIYLAKYLGEQITPEPREVADVRFVLPEKLREELIANPDLFIPGMLMVMNQCWDKL